MDKLFAKRMDELAPSGIRKVNEKALAMERAGETVIHFELGRPDFDTPEYIKKACIADIEKGDVFYTSNFGTMELREAIAWKLKTQNNVDYKPSEIIVSVGLSEAVFDIMTAILDEGDEILVPNPGWLNYLNVPKLLGATPITYTLKEENDYQIDLDEIRAKVTPRTKAMVLITPSNPTGGVLAENVLKELAEIAVKNDIMVISDEVYERLLYDDAKHISIASLPGMKERTILINGFSKSYAMTGWRLGYACGPEVIIKQMLKIHQYAIMCAPTTSQYAAVEALRNGDEDVAKMREEYNGRRRYLMHRFKEMGLSCFEPFGAFYVFPCIKEFGMTSEEFATKLLNSQKVAVVPGTAFGDCGEGYLRISYAYSLEDLKKALDRMEIFIQELREEKN